MLASSAIKTSTESMHSASRLRTDLADLGIKPHDTVLVHSSMKAVGAVDGGADTVLDVLAQHLATGLLLLPTHTWSDRNNADGIFDPATEPSCVGLLSERFRKRPGVVRSWHPTHSIAGLGSTAATFLAGEEQTRSPCPRSGCWGRLYDVGTHILFLGASLRTNTFLHSVEEWHNVPDRLATEPTLFRIRTPSGQLIPCPQHRHHSSLGDVSQFYDKVEPELLRRGIAREGRIGDARAVLCNVRAMADYVSELLKQDLNYFGYR